MLKSVVRRIYYVLDFNKNCVSMLREQLIHSLHYPEFVWLTSFIKNEYTHSLNTYYRTHLL